jgi:uncharacterized membrane protein YGL010W
MEAQMTRKIDMLLAEYGESHQNSTNKAVHWVCVPVIVWCVMALVYSLPVPSALAGLVWVNWLGLVLALALIYYLVLSPTLAIGVGLFAALGLWLIHAIAANSARPIWQIALVLFVLAWAGQFWGHKVEGKKPSFFKDIQFLLIGPAWLLSFLYRRLGIPI